MLGEGTVEELIYKRQISKAAVVSGVCDDEQIATAYSQDELNELWTLREALPPPAADLLARPEARFPSVGGLGADAVLKRVLASDDAGAWVSDVISHDSLLEVDDSLELSTEERQAGPALEP